MDSEPSSAGSCDDIACLQSQTGQIPNLAEAKSLGAEEEKVHYFLKSEDHQLISYLDRQANELKGKPSHQHAERAVIGNEKGCIATEDGTITCGQQENQLTNYITQDDQRLAPFTEQGEQQTDNDRQDEFGELVGVFPGEDELAHVFTTTSTDVDGLPSDEVMMNLFTSHFFPDSDLDPHESPLGDNRGGIVTNSQTASTSPSVLSAVAMQPEIKMSTFNNLQPNTCFFQEKKATRNLSLGEIPTASLNDTSLPLTSWHTSTDARRKPSASIRFDFEEAAKEDSSHGAGLQGSNSLIVDRYARAMEEVPKQDEGHLRESAIAPCNIAHINVRNCADFLSHATSCVQPFNMTMPLPEHHLAHRVNKEMPRCKSNSFKVAPNNSVNDMGRTPLPMPFSPCKIAKPTNPSNQNLASIQPQDARGTKDGAPLPSYYPTGPNAAPMILPQQRYLGSEHTPLQTSWPFKPLSSQSPIKPLTAYNFFFRDERDRIVLGVKGSDDIYDDNKKQHLLLHHLIKDRTTRRKHRKTHGKIEFTNLSRVIGQRWKNLSEEQKSFYRDIAAKDAERYKLELAVYESTNAHGHKSTL